MSEYQNSRRLFLAFRRAALLMGVHVYVYGDGAYVYGGGGEYMHGGGGNGVYGHGV